MARNIRVIHGRDFIRARPDGQLDLAETEQIFREVLGAAEGLPSFDILLDTRDAVSTLSSGDLLFLTEWVGKLPELSRARTAIVCPVERLDHVWFFALQAAKKGICVQAFLDYEDAIKWLTEAG